LKVSQRLGGGGAKDPIDSTHIESQRCQARLDVGDVVAPKGGVVMVEDPVSKAKARLNQPIPGLWANDPINT
jgi:hypothetical protein